MKYWYKIIQMEDGTMEPVISFHMRGYRNVCITQGKGVCYINRNKLEELPDGEQSKMLRVYARYLQKLYENSFTSSHSNEDMSIAWGRLRGEDALISKEEALKRINKRIAKTGYTARFMDDTKRERTLFHVFFEKRVEPIDELRDLLLKCEVMGKPVPSEEEYPLIKDMIYKNMWKHGIMASDYSLRNVVEVDENGLVYHLLLVKWPVLCTEIGIRNFLEDMGKMLRYGVE